MNLTNLKSFLAVVEYRSLTLAAKKLFVTQSAMTKRIQKLEDELGARLIIVDGVKTKITDAGKIFIPYARQMLAMDNEMRNNIEHLEQQSKSPALILGTSIYLAHYIIPYFAQYFYSQNQGELIDIRVINERDFFEYLDNGLVDIVLCTTRPNIDKTIYWETLWQEKLSLAFSVNHPLAKKDKISLADLAKYEAVFPEKKGYIREKVSELFSNHHLSLNSTMDAGSIYTVKNYISTDNYWSFIHQRFLDMTELKSAELAEGSLTMAFSVYCIKRRHQEKLISLFLQQFKLWMADSDIIKAYSLS
ncbi:HTH-type transcriptional activator CmpR [Legionella massiliensis]|uniref:HTH-type transcriptional activator CmpR n=1 Tax=Legionella massiliensis TaxID=1034943 RepID=A0A078KWA1_9GAMM|nr:LysR family transcriptional regulator [Legionella massiliensis]CDZ77282.1 HTH-type transcriptional activator CmpR [Legionella massiliensis]CEE13020.1 HTH-type transcriptional activator CmpR [Legionella massiliensis]